MRHRDFGLLHCDPHRVTPGVTLFSPLNGKATYIIGQRGEVLHQWEHPLVNGTYAYLLDSGNLLWSGRLPEGPQHMGGRGGLLREYDWNGKVLWEHRHVGQHHDFRRLPNGNTIFLGWEVVPPDLANRIPGGLPSTRHPDGCMYGDNIFEVTPNGDTVWEWHACRDMEIEKYPLVSNQLRDEFAHANAISPLPNGDIYISFRRLNTIGLIDKQTRKMKWQHRDDSFGMQHDCAPLPNGNITLFANGINTTTNPFSRVIELDPRTHKIVWEYRAKPAYTFFSRTSVARSGSQPATRWSARASGSGCSRSRQRARSSGSMSAHSWGRIVPAIHRTRCFGLTAMPWICAKSEAASNRSELRVEERGWRLRPCCSW